MGTSGGWRRPAALDIQSSDIEHSDNQATKFTQRKRRNLPKTKRPLKSAPSETVNRKGAIKVGALEGNKEAVAREKNASPEQLKFYSGIMLEIMKHAIVLVRIYLLTQNGFPDMSTIYKFVKIAYRAACRSKLGAHWKGATIYYLSPTYLT